MHDGPREPVCNGRDALAAYVSGPPLREEFTLNQIFLHLFSYISVHFRGSSSKSEVVCLYDMSPTISSIRDIRPTRIYSEHEVCFTLQCLFHWPQQSCSCKGAGYVLGCIAGSPHRILFWKSRPVGACVGQQEQVFRG